MLNNLIVASGTNVGNRSVCAARSSSFLVRASWRHNAEGDSSSTGDDGGRISRDHDIFISITITGTSTMTVATTIITLCSRCRRCQRR